MRRELQKQQETLLSGILVPSWNLNCPSELTTTKQRMRNETWPAYRAIQDSKNRTFEGYSTVLSHVCTRTVRGSTPHRLTKRRRHRVSIFGEFFRPGDSAPTFGRALLCVFFSANFIWREICQMFGEYFNRDAHCCCARWADVGRRRRRRGTCRGQTDSEAYSIYCWRPRAKSDDMGSHPSSPTKSPGDVTAQRQALRTGARDTRKETSPAQAFLLYASTRERTQHALSPRLSLADAARRPAILGPPALEPPRPARRLERQTKHAWYPSAARRSYRRLLAAA